MGSSNSRLMNMEMLSEFLAESGHSVSMLINDRIRQVITTTKVTLIVYPIPPGRKVIMSSDKEIRDIVIEAPGPKKFLDFWINDFLFPVCKSLLEQRDLLESLKEKQFDLLLLDIGDHCGGRILVDFLDIPTLLYSNYGYLLVTLIYIILHLHLLSQWERATTISQTKWIFSTDWVISLLPPLLHHGFTPMFVQPLMTYDNPTT